MNEAIAQLNAPLEVEIVGDLKRIRASGIELMPALVLEGKILHQGRTPSLQETKKLLTEAMEALSAQSN